MSNPQDEHDAARAAEAEGQVASEIIDLRQTLKAQEKTIALNERKALAGEIGITKDKYREFVTVQADRPI